MLLRERDVDSPTAARLVLDHFGVPARLQHVRQFVWRGGELRLDAVDDAARGTSVFYELAAQWESAVLVEEAARSGLLAVDATVVDGRWVRARTGYVLRIGIELAVPSAIFIRSDRQPLSFVPFLNRPAEQVEHALDADLRAYVNRFLDMRLPVPRAAAADAERLRRLGISGT